MTALRGPCHQLNPLKPLEDAQIEALLEACREVSNGKHDSQFPIDVFQTGSGTSTNMNANEVLATLATQASGTLVTPNDHVNMSQSSNDVIPTAIQLSAAIGVADRLLPSLEHLASSVTIQYQQFLAKRIMKASMIRLVSMSWVMYCSSMVGIL